MSLLSTLRFQSTPPRGGATMATFPIPVCSHISIHAPARGGDQLYPHAVFVGDISIHAPARGGDQLVGVVRVRLDISIHAPARGGDEGRRKHEQDGAISIHAPARGGDRIETARRSPDSHFNPRPREGGRPRAILAMQNTHGFQSTPPRGGATAKMHSFTCGSLTNK